MPHNVIQLSTDSACETAVLLAYCFLDVFSVAKTTWTGTESVNITTQTILTSSHSLVEQ